MIWILGLTVACLAALGMALARWRFQVDPVWRQADFEVPDTVIEADRP